MKMTCKRPQFLSGFVLFCAILATASIALGQSGVWTNTLGGTQSYSLLLNWENGIMASGYNSDGSGATADFSKITIPVTVGVGAITVTSAGSGYSVAPSVTITDPTGSQAVGTATITGLVTSITVTSYGSGYTNAPAVTFSGGGGAGAAATATMTGMVVSITITNVGSNYTSAPTVAFSGGGGGSGAAGTAAISATGTVTNVTITSGGGNYGSAPTIAFSGGGGSGAGGTVRITGSLSAVNLTAGGSGYTSDPTIAFSNTGGSGAAATTAITGGVSAIATTTAGIDYTAPTITISAPDAGTTATATAKLATNGNSTFTVNLDTNAIVQNILFGTLPIGGVTFGGNWVLADAGAPLTLDSLITSNSVISVNLSNGAAANLVGWSTATITANIQGTNTLVKTGDSPLILNPTAGNSYSGGTIISNGMVELGTDAGSGGNVNPSGTSLGSGPIIFAGGTLRQQNAAIPGDNPSTTPTENAVANNIIVPAGQSGTIYTSPRAFPSIGGGSATITGSGTLNVSVDYVRDSVGGDWSGFTGRLNFFPSTRSGGNNLRIDPLFNYANGSWSNTAVHFTTNGINGNTIAGYSENNGFTTVPPYGLTINFGEMSSDGNCITWQNPENSAGSGGSSTGGYNTVFAVGWLNTTAIYGGTTGTGFNSFVKVGAGTWIWDGPASGYNHTGMTVISNGVLQIGDDDANGALGWSPEVTNYSALSFDRSDTAYVITNILTGTGVISNIGPGAVTLSPAGGANTYTGQTFVNNGALAITNQGALGASPATFTANQIVLNGGMLNAAANTVINDGNRGVTIGPSGGALGAGLNSTLTVANVIGGAGNLTISNSGTVALTGANNNTGETIVRSGNLALASAAPLGGSPASSNPAQLTLNGGALTSTATFALNTANAGVTIGASGGTIVPSLGTSLTISEPLAGPGNLNINGPGTVVINSTDGGTGNILIDQGILAVGVGGSIAAPPVIAVASGAELDVSANGYTLGTGQTIEGSGSVLGTFTAGTGSTVAPATNGVVGALTFANLVLNGGATAAIDIAANSNDLISVTGALTLNGANTISLTLLGVLPNGTYHLIKYGSLNGNVGTLTLAGFGGSRLTPTLVDNVANQSIDLTLSGSPGAIVWQGGLNGNVWDVVTTKNWLNGGIADFFYDGDAVSFTDVGAANPNVVLNTVMTPGSVAVNSSASYTISGAGGIGGSLATLTQAGPGALTLLTTNSFGGGTTISAGTIQLGNGTAGGTLGSGAISDNGSLVYDLPGSQTVSSQISGTGSLSAQAGTLVLTANNSYGATSIGSGATLQVGSGLGAGSLGTGNVSDGGTLIYDRTGVVTNAAAINGGGGLTVEGGGIVYLAQSNGYAGPTLVSNSILVVGVGSTNGSVGAQQAVTLTNGGTLAFDRSDTFTNFVSISGTNGTLIQAGTGTLVITNNFNNVSANKVLAGTLQVGDGVDTNGILLGGIIVSNTGTLEYDHPDNIAISNVISGNGNLAQIGAGTLDIIPPVGNTYSGTTTISNSTIILGNPSANSDIADITANQTGLGSSTVVIEGSTSLLQLAGSEVNDPSGGSGAGNFTNAIDVPASQSGSMWLPGRFTLSSFVSGSGTLTLGVNYVRGAINANWTNFYGQVNAVINPLVTSATDDLRYGDTNGMPNARLFINDNVNFYAQAITANLQIPIGELTGSTLAYIRSASGGGTSPGVNETWVVGGLNTSAAYYGYLVDGNSFVKEGTGTWTLAGVSQHTGTTTVGNGTLALSGDGVTTGVLSETPTIDVVSPGVIDVSGLPDDTFHVGDGNVSQGAQTLEGNGLVRSDTYIGFGGVLAPGTAAASIQVGSLVASARTGSNYGNFTINGNLRVDGALDFKVDHIAGTINDSITALSISNDPNAMLNVTQASTNYLETGDTFKLLNIAGNTGLSTATNLIVNLPPTSPDGVITYTWATNLAVNGTVTVTSGAAVTVNRIPGNLGASVSGGVLHLSWPGNQLGWDLQTNSIDIANPADWFTYPGSAGVTNEDIDISHTGNTFFRLHYSY
ncbi:MAG TPA: autotransporter-associated beta strand repeat-containing protein [Verrucomicrobiae bacterium]|jgi:autotransporter-associated beta strand protein|nr:autotransporter-associated beta strand repeat-containing protein [Verrucomicrobiae bacterium]